MTLPKQNVFLTGATGTIGSAVLEVLSSSNEFAVDCLLRRPESAAQVERAGGHVVLGDMADDELFQCLRGAKDYQYIVHCAQGSYRHDSARAINDLDRRAVANLERLRTGAPNLMIYTSGVWIFGHQERSGQISDSTPLRPFLAAKARALLVEELLRQTTYPWAHLCPPSIVYGSVGPLVAVVEAMKIAAIEVIDDKSVQWSIIERLDLARAYLALLRNGSASEFYVVAEDDPVGVIDFYETVARYVPGSRLVRKSRAHFETTLDDESLERRYANQPVDSTGIKQRTGWRARESFKSSVARFLMAM